MELYNTLGRKKEEIQQKAELSVYACGPTVYDYAHIGNLRNYVFVDTLHRTLLLNGFDVNLVINITDVGHLTDDADQGEDKLEKRSKQKGKDIWELAQFYEDAFKADVTKLNILPPTTWPRATDHIQEQIDLIQKITENGHTYMTSDGLYFDTSTLDEYGELIPNFNPESLDAGHRVEMKEKRNPTDFALWKLSGEQNRQMEWDSPWGVGFPGWHVECTAMGCKYLGETFDIHTGGVDHIPVHHTNELAQARGAFTHQHANIWMHGEFLNLKDGKMSKSKGDFVRLQTVQDKGFSPLDFRYLCLLTKYRKPLEFSWDALEAARKARLHLKQKIPSVPSVTVIHEDIKDAFSDDLNTPKAIGILNDVLQSDASDTYKKGVAIFANHVLGLNLLERKEIPEEVVKLAEERELLREQKNYSEADAVREKIEEKGYHVLDTPDGFILQEQ